MNAQRELCEDYLDSLLFGARLAANSCGVNVVAVFSRQRANNKKHQELEAKYCLYHDLMSILRDHGYVSEETYNWESLRPVIEEMESLATELSLSPVLK